MGLGLRGIANHLADICGRCWDVSFVTNYRHSFQNDSQVVEEILNTPRAPLAVTADKAYDSVKVRQQIMDEGALPRLHSQQCGRRLHCLVLFVMISLIDSHHVRRCKQI